MKRNSYKYPTAVVLLSVFTLFTLGLPIVTSLCPMDSTMVACCPLSAGDQNGSSLTNQMGSCCTKIMVADRNTTPFLKAQPTFASFQPILHTVFLSNSSPDKSPSLQFAGRSFDDPPLDHGEPLFILHAALLI